MKKNYLFSLLILVILLTPTQKSEALLSIYNYDNFFYRYTNNISRNFGGLGNIFQKVNFGNLFSTNQNLDKYSGKNNGSSDSIDKYKSDDEVGLLYSSDSNSNPTSEKPTTLDKVSDLITGNSQPQTEDQKAEQQKKLFTSCADSLYGGNVMSPECKQFPDSDYQKYITAKNTQSTSNSNMPSPVNTSVGQVTPTSGGGQSYGGNTVQSDSINTNRIPQTPKEEYEERDLIEPQTPSNFDISKTNTNAEVSFDGWITGKATLFAINGGANEAGQKMNKTTAFGYNPYYPKTCIVSLPYKTIDKFFGTTLDQCIKAKNSSCIGKIKKSVKDRAIEVIMLKNGKRGIFPLGDLGPAEWTGNAIDFTRCTGNFLGATGKDMVRFRPAPKGSEVTK